MSKIKSFLLPRVGFGTQQKKREPCVDFSTTKASPLFFLFSDPIVVGLRTSFVQGTPAGGGGGVCWVDLVPPRPFVDVSQFQLESWHDSLLAPNSLLAPTVFQRATPSCQRPSLPANAFCSNTREAAIPWRPSSVLLTQDKHPGYRVSIGLNLYLTIDQATPS